MEKAKADYEGNFKENFEKINKEYEKTWAEVLELMK